MLFYSYLYILYLHLHFLPFRSQVASARASSTTRWQGRRLVWRWIRFWTTMTKSSTRVCRSSMSLRPIVTQTHSHANSPHSLHAPAQAHTVPSSTLENASVSVCADRARWPQQKQQNKKRLQRDLHLHHLQEESIRGESLRKDGSAKRMAIK